MYLAETLSLGFLETGECFSSSLSIVWVGFIIIIEVQLITAVCYMDRVDHYHMGTLSRLRATLRRCQIPF